MRAYYDAYVKAKYDYEMQLEQDTLAMLAKAGEMGSSKAMARAERILNKAVTKPVKPEWRARTITLAEALYRQIQIDGVEAHQGIE